MVIHYLCNFRAIEDYQDFQDNEGKKEIPVQGDSLVDLVNPACRDLLEGKETLVYLDLEDQERKEIRVISD